MVKKVLIPTAPHLHLALFTCTLKSIADADFDQTLLVATK